METDDNNRLGESTPSTQTEHEIEETFVMNNPSHYEIIHEMAKKRVF